MLQEPAPMTEDLLEEQSEVLAKLGTSAEGAHLRARMQSACLLSDMESFKVVVLEEFCKIAFFLIKLSLLLVLNNFEGFTDKVLFLPSTKQFQNSLKLKKNPYW